MGLKWLLLGIFVFCIPLVLSCPQNYSDCITWGNEKSMLLHSVNVSNESCNISIHFAFDSGKDRWGHILVNYQDMVDGKDSYAIYKDGLLAGTVADLTLNETRWAFGKTFLWPERVYGRHELEIKKTEKDGCQALNINWIALKVNETYYSGGSGGGGGGGRGAPQEAPVNPPPPEEIPEFGVLGLILALLGSVTLIGLMRKK